jgi:hypothetical protein
MRGFEYKKSLNIPRGKSESVIQRTDNTMAKIKRPNTDLQNTTQKTKDRATQTFTVFIHSISIKIAG